MRRSSIALTLVVVIAVTPAAAEVRPALPASAAQPAFVRLTMNAPLYVRPDASRTPLRVGSADSRLKVIATEGDWYQVEFEDPQWGRRVGYVERRFTRPEPAQPESLTPVDVSVPAESVAREPAPAAPATPIREAAESEARLLGGQPAQPRSEMPRGLMWSGVGLLAGGAGTALAGAAIRTGCDEDYNYYDDIQECQDIGLGFYILGGTLAATGAVLLGVASARRRVVAPSVTVHRGRFLVQQRVTF